MSTHRSLPSEIDAVQFTGDVAEIWEHFGAEGIYGLTERNPDHLILTTLHGDPAPCRVGDWVVAEPEPGHFYPIKAEVFAAKYRTINQAAGSVWQGRHPGVAHFEQVFTFEHLPVGRMRSISRECAGLAAFMVENLPDNAELSAGLRALWEAKNCFVLLASGKFDGEGGKS